MNLNWRMRSGLKTDEPYIFIGSGGSATVDNLDAADKVLKQEFELPTATLIDWVNYGPICVDGPEMLTTRIPNGEDSRWEVQLLMKPDENLYARDEDLTAEELRYSYRHS